MKYKHPDTTILVFCKAPMAGQVKTRLMPQLNAEQAAEIHMTLTHRILKLLSDAELCPIQLWCSPDSNHPFFRGCTDKYPLTLHKQLGSDLGERMFHAISDALQTSSNVLLIGCDCPTLTIHDFDSAIHALNGNYDAVIAPAEDGGYVMIGLNQSHSDLFLNMTWGNEHVLNSTLKRAEELSLNVYKTGLQWDVDSFDDLQHFYQM